MRLLHALLTAAVFSLFATTHIMCAHAQPAPFKIDAGFPGGNIKIDKIEGDVVHLSPDLRTTTTPWFYWYFRVSGAGGRTLTFVFDQKNIGARGPGVSVDGGQSWKWMGIEAVQDGQFSYAFPADANDVRFSVGMPYVRSNFDAFLARHKGSPFLKAKTLTQTPKGRDVVMVQVGEKDGKAPYAVVVTARHHACEMMASYILEGLLEEAIDDDALGRELRAKADFLFVPFADTDGVEDGDQGKNRAPHDHNRDYGETPLYKEVAAIKQQVPAWIAGRRLLFMDLHDPALKGDVHETIHFMEPMDRDQAARMSRLCDLLARDFQGPIGYSSAGIMRFGKGYNTKIDKDVHASGWARTLPNTVLGFTLETAYANAGGYEVNAYSARELGRDLALALKDFLGEKPETIKAAP
jgi:hypothetical protein